MQHYTSPLIHAHQSSPCSAFRPTSAADTEVACGLRIPPDTVGGGPRLSCTLCCRRPQTANDSEKVRLRRRGLPAVGAAGLRTRARCCRGGFGTGRGSRRHGGLGRAGPHPRVVATRSHPNRVGRDEPRRRGAVAAPCPLGLPCRRTRLNSRQAAAVHGYGEIHPTWRSLAPSRPPAIPFAR